MEIVDAGSISRAATTIHVAQPALSQQISELEERLGVKLLQRYARGVRPTSAGEILYREASVILRLMEQLPAIVRSHEGEVEGTVSLGMSSTISAALSGPFVQACRATYPSVVLKFSVADSETIKARIEANDLDLGVVFENDLVARFARKPIYRQRLFYVPVAASSRSGISISLAEVARQPLILPSLPNVTRVVMDAAFMRTKLTPNIVMEADQLQSLVSAVLQGVGGTILPKGDFSSDPATAALPPPLVLEPPIFLTASIISSSDYPLPPVGEAVRDLLADFLKKILTERADAGAESI